MTFLSNIHGFDKFKISKFKATDTYYYELKTTIENQCSDEEESAMNDKISGGYNYF